MKVTMPYIGKDLSVNYYRIRGRAGVQTNKIKPHVTAWMEDLASKVRKGMQGCVSSRLVVSVLGKFRDDRVPDIDNLAKVILDAVEMGTGRNDRDMRFISEGYLTGYSSPCLDITVAEDLSA